MGSIPPSCEDRVQSSEWPGGHEFGCISAGASRRANVDLSKFPGCGGAKVPGRAPMTLFGAAGRARALLNANEHEFCQEGAPGREGSASLRDGEREAGAGGGET